MPVRTTANTLGLEADDRGGLSGTIEDSIVLAALEELASVHTDHADLFIVTSDRVRSSRSAGLEILEANSVFGRYRDCNEIQLRYPGEMKGVFDDLLIAVPLRGVDMNDSEDDTTGVYSHS